MKTRNAFVRTIVGLGPANASRATLERRARYSGRKARRAERLLRRIRRFDPNGTTIQQLDASDFEDLE